jgi:hypothetical protein
MSLAKPIARRDFWTVANRGVGLLQVTADPADRRSCQVKLTSAGVKERTRLTEEGLDRFGSFVADWDPEEVRTLTRLLEEDAVIAIVAIEHADSEYGRPSMTDCAARPSSAQGR